MALSVEAHSVTRRDVTIGPREAFEVTSQVIALATSARAKEILVSRVGERVNYIESRRACPVGST